MSKSKGKGKSSENVVIEPETCPICADGYTAVARKKVSCLSCHKDMCIKCVERYLLSSVEDPHCLHCRNSWTRSFLATICSMTFLNKTYYVHRQEILVNREKSFLPSYQPIAEREIRANEIAKEDAAVAEEYFRIEKEMNSLLTELNRKRSAIWRRVNNIRAGRDEFSDDSEKVKATPTKFMRRCTSPDCKGFLSTAWKCGLCNTWACPDCFEIKGLVHDAPHTCTAEALATAALIRKDTKPCPTCAEMIYKIDGCFAADTPVLGWNNQIILAKDIKVGDELIGDDGTKRIVQTICSGEDEMFEVEQTNGISYTVNSKHKLALLSKTKITDIVEIPVDEFIHLPETATNNLFGFKLKSNSLSIISVKSIGKGTYYGWSIDENKRFVLKDFTVVRNCDQMFCTSCHNPFSWNTGKSITTGIIHNPHYFQWLAKGGHVPTNPGYIPCGGLPNPYRIQNALRVAHKDDRKELLDILRTCNHISDVERHRYERHLHPLNNEDIGVQYLLKESSEENWKQVLAKREKERQKCNEIRDILDAFNGAAIDLFNRIDINKDYYVQEGTKLINEIVHEMNELRKFTFTAMNDVGKSFNCSVPYINEKWEVIHGTERTRMKKEEKMKEEEERELLREKERIRMKEEKMKEEKERILREKEARASSSSSV